MQWKLFLQGIGRISTVSATVYNISAKLQIPEMVGVVATDVTMEEMQRSIPIIK